MSPQSAAPFVEGFTPLIAETLAAAGEPIAVEERFVTDAVRALEDAGIPYVDLYHDSKLAREHFAAGDHYNMEGRGVVTDIVAETLVALLGSGG